MKFSGGFVEEINRAMKNLPMNSNDLRATERAYVWLLKNNKRSEREHLNVFMERQTH